MGWDPSHPRSLRATRPGRPRPRGHGCAGVSHAVPSRRNVPAVDSVEGRRGHEGQGGDPVTQVDLEIVGGRVVDPATKVDRVATVGVHDGRIAYISSDGPRGAETTLDASELVVAPGFVDIHSHADDNISLQLQVLDGVTTALELEAGASPVRNAYAHAQEQGRITNFGFSASWAQRRMEALAGVKLTGSHHTFFENIGKPDWRRHATKVELNRLLDALQDDFTNGALGIGMLVGYAQEIDPVEYQAVAALAESAGVPVYTHARDLSETRADVLIDGAQEIIQAAIKTGARMHYCHVNSTSRQHLDRVHADISRAWEEGARLTLESHPYGAGMTGIGAEFLSPERLPEWGITPERLLYAPTGEWVGTNDRLRELRSQDPGGLVLIQYFDERNERDLAMMTAAIQHEHTVIASDAMTVVPPPGAAPGTWSLADGRTHPRTSGTFSRGIRMLHRDQGLPLMEVLAKVTSMPSKVLEGADGMARKGTLKVGSDADITIFDPTTITDQATPTESTRTSTGVQHVFVHGQAVVSDGKYTGALPGRPVRW
ncbi:D-glutamate deacylase [Rhodococcus sp. WS4]|nr:D-glutamate deacylase [Rhodococcus sp. WS4]